MNALAIALLSGLGAMIGWGVADFFGKLCISDVGELPSLFWGHLAGAILLGAVTLGREVGASHVNYGRIDGRVIAILAFFGCLQALVYLLLYRGFAAGQMVVLSPTFASYSGVVALVSILFFGERVDTLKVLALVATFVGIVLLSSASAEDQRAKLFGAPGFSVILAATVCAAGWTLGWDRLVHNRDPISFVFFMYSFMTIALFAVAVQQKADLRAVNRSAWPKLVVIGLGEMGAYSAFTWGFSETNLTSVVALLSGAASLPTIALARAFLGERLSRVQAIGVASVLGGIALLTIS